MTWISYSAFCRPEQLDSADCIFPINYRQPRCQQLLAFGTRRVTLCRSTTASRLVHPNFILVRGAKREPLGDSMVVASASGCRRGGQDNGYRCQGCAATGTLFLQGLT